MKPTGIIIHHSLTKDGIAADWDAIKRYHMTDPQHMWSDIGYHAGVERINGTLTALTGRPVNQIGAHCQGHNDTIGICIVGNFDQTPPDDELLRYAAALTAGFCRMFDFTVDHIHKHHEYATKSCPGAAFPWTLFLKYVEAAL